MALLKSLSNMQKVKRSMKLREDGVSDEQMVEIMEEMINAALVAQASGDKGMMKRSLEELRQVRKDVRTGNVKLSTGKQKTIVGRFSNLVDQLENEQNSVKQESGGGVGGIMSSLPSPETLISAVMTSNPLLGYSAKIMKDIGGSVKNKKEADKEAARRQAQILEEQKDYVLDRKAELEMESEINEAQKNQLSDYDVILRNIESELIKLRKVWEGDDTELVKENDTELVKENVETNNNLSKLVEAEQRILEEQRLKREQDEFADIEQSRQDSDGGLVGADTSDEQGGSGIMGGIIASFMGGGFMKGLMGVFGILKSIGAVGMTLLKIGLKGSIIGAVIMSIYNFIDGFFNAGDILDMDEADLNIGDRIIAGFANVWGSIIKLFDTVLEWFGIDLFDSEDIEKDIAKFAMKTVDGIIDWVTGLFDKIMTSIREFDLSETLTSVKNDTIKLIDELVDIIPNMVTDSFKQIGGLFSDAANWIFGDDDDDDKEKSNRQNPRGSGKLEMDGSTASKGMPDATKNLENSSYQGSGQGSNAVIAGNGNTTIHNSKTEVQTIGNTSNTDDSIRQNNFRVLDRLRGS